jgi:hypothetical protein
MNLIANLTAFASDWRSAASAAGLVLLVATAAYARRRTGGSPGDARPGLPGDVDRRTQPRWNTRRVTVTVADADTGKVLGTATVFDRSVDGVRLLADLMLEAGARLRIRREEAGDEAWAAVEVRHCRRADGGWVLGCRFTERLPWDESARLG